MYLDLSIWGWLAVAFGSAFVLLVFCLGLYLLTLILCELWDIFKWRRRARKRDAEF